MVKVGRPKGRTFEFNDSPAKAGRLKQGINAALKAKALL